MDSQLPEARRIENVEELAFNSLYWILYNYIINGRQVFKSSFNSLYWIPSCVLVDYCWQGGLSILCIEFAELEAFRVDFNNVFTFQFFVLNSLAEKHKYRSKSAFITFNSLYWILLGKIEEAFREAGCLSILCIEFSKIFSMLGAWFSISFNSLYWIHLDTLIVLQECLETFNSLYWIRILDYVNRSKRCQGLSILCIEFPINRMTTTWQ